jgi:hypothetical protein
VSQVLRAVLIGQMPSGKNAIRTQVTAGGIHRFPKRRFEEWRGTAYAQLDRQRGAWVKLAAPARVNVRYWPGDLIRRDPPGMMDALSHVLEWCPVHGKRKVPGCALPFVADDSLLVSWFWRLEKLDRARPRLDLVIEPHEAGE